MDQSTLGIYVHLPFCPYICPYCDFAKWPMQRSRASAYLTALRTEISAAPGASAATIFYGGGTPNAYDAQEIAALTDLLVLRFPSAAGREISIELNPELVRDGDFATYAAAGIDRVSIGVQSFDSAEIATLGRKHTPAEVGRAVSGARDAGIRSVSIDLIFAVPGQTPRSWERSLDSALELGADHISTYGLTIEDGTPFARWHEREPAAFADDALEAELYALAIDRLEGAGYEHYEISNFARPGHRCAHNQNYWKNGEYLGFGVGAASYRDGERRLHTRDLRTYIAAASAGLPIPGEAERLCGIKAVGEAIMIALRTAQGVALAEFKERYGVDVAERYAPVVARYVSDGLLERTDDRIILTKRGRFFANDVCGAFVTFE
ncbi:MAG TPA: radical SAM family heme chaperone HemW [Candidatus Acidoferrales bacterium]|nr:radical SAM family heme chaperone HemW [Candidatus Acidoferrales bacterium]